MIYEYNPFIALSRNTWHSSLVVCTTHQQQQTKGCQFLSVIRTHRLFKQAKNDLEVIDQLITDIQLCKPLEREKAIRIEWTSETGENHICDIWISGSNQASMDMLMLAEHEREDLRTSLLTELEKI